MRLCLSREDRTLPLLLENRLVADLMGLDLAFRLFLLTSFTSSSFLFLGQGHVDLITQELQIDVAASLLSFFPQNWHPPN